MSTLTDLVLPSNITGQEVVGGKLHVRLADGGRYEIPLIMLGHFRAPYAPPADAELLILDKAPAVQSVDVTADMLIVTFADGRVLSTPLTWFPRLWHGTPSERQAVEIWGETGLHWEELDEDIDAVQLFRMTGPSAESEASIQRWLAKRRAQYTNLPSDAAAMQVAETSASYSANQVQQATE